MYQDYLLERVTGTEFKSRNILLLKNALIHNLQIFAIVQFMKYSTPWKPSCFLILIQVLNSELSIGIKNHLAT